MEEWERKERTDGRLRRGGSEGEDEDSSRPSLRERERERSSLFLNYFFLQKIIFQ